MSGIIRLVDVVKAEGNQRVVNEVSLTIEEKERVQVYGAPGSGRAALMRLIAGMEPPTEGEIYLLDKSVHGMDERTAAAFRNRYIGVIRPENGFMDRLSVLDNVALPLAVRGMPRAKREYAVKEQLKALGIPHILRALPSQLNTFEARLASVARALVAQPKILLIDDIAVNLPLKEAERMTGMLYAICEYGDFTVVSFETEKSCALRPDRYIYMVQGKIQEDIS